MNLKNFIYKLNTQNMTYEKAQFAEKQSFSNLTAYKKSSHFE